MMVIDGDIKQIVREMLAIAADPDSTDDEWAMADATIDDALYGGDEDFEALVAKWNALG